VHPLTIVPTRPNTFVPAETVGGCNTGRGAGWLVIGVLFAVRRRKR